jgi:hypothetical protein
MFCAPRIVTGGTEGVRSRFHVAPRHVFGGTEGVGSRFHVLRFQTIFGRYLGRRVPFSFFALSDSFRAVPRAPDPVFMFCAPRLVFDGSDDLGSRWHILRSRTRFWRYKGRRGSFSCIALPDSFLAVLRASGSLFNFCAPGHVFGGTKGVRYCFHVLCSRTRFGRYRVRQVPYSCFALPDSFSTVPRASWLIFMFCAPGLFLGGTEGAESRFHVLRSRTRFGRYRVRQVPFSSFALPDTLWAVPRASGPVFMFGGTEGARSRFHVLCNRTRSVRYRGRRIPFSCFTLPYSFSTVTRTLGPVGIFCTSGHVFGGNESVRSRFHVLRSRTHFRRYRVRRVPFSNFALPDSFSTVPRASGLISIF